MEKRICQNTDCKIHFIHKVHNQIYCCVECKDATYKKDKKSSYIKKEPKNLLPYDKLKKVVNEYPFEKIDQRKKYERIQKKYRNWVSIPHDYYDEWVSWDVFLGNDTIIFLTLKELKEEVNQIKSINSGESYRKEQKKHKNWIYNPAQLNDWVSWFHFLENEKPTFLLYEEHIKEIKEIKYVVSRRTYEIERGKHDDWVSSPCRKFKNEWISWKVFLSKPERYCESCGVKLLKNQKKTCGDDRCKKDYRNKKIHERKDNDPLFKLSMDIRRLILNSLKSGGWEKKSRTHEILGCSYEEFLSYIESQFKPWMNWDNHGKYTGCYNETWQYDHIIPIASCMTEEEVLTRNHYTNFQPLCSKENNIKSDKLM